VSPSQLSPNSLNLNLNPVVESEVEMTPIASVSQNESDDIDSKINKHSENMRLVDEANCCCFA
jgi:hypothetical protein